MATTTAVDDVETKTNAPPPTKQRSTGTVKWFSAQKGYGFVAIDDGTDDLFVHQTSIQSEGFRTLTEGQPVEFSIDFGEDGRTKAVDVVPFARSRRSSTGRGGRGSGRGNFGERGRGRGGGGGRDGGYERRIGGGGGGGGRDFECYNCGRIGHLARDCYHRGGDGGGGGEKRYGSGGGGGGERRYGGGGGGRACYSCGGEGHLARDCPTPNNNNKNEVEE